MADNAQKTPLLSSYGKNTELRILDHIQLMSGRAPVSIVSTDKTNTIATIKFETDPSTYKLPNITIPIHGPEYERFPWQKGDKGWVAAADFDLGGMTGLGASGAASFARPANLASLVFHALGNMILSETDDKQARVGYGPNGTIHRDTGKKAQIKTSPGGGAQIQGGGDGAGNYPHSSTADGDGVTHKSSKKVKTDAPTHEVTQNQTLGGNLIGSGSGVFSGGMSVGGLISGLMGGPASFASGSVEGAVGALGADLSGTLPNPTVKGATGLPVYASKAAARAALGAWKFYVDSAVGAQALQTITVGGGGSGTVTIPAVPSFYAQGILVVCSTGA